MNAHTHFSREKFQGYSKLSDKCLALAGFGGSFVCTKYKPASGCGHGKTKHADVGAAWCDVDKQPQCGHKTLF